MNVLVLSHLYPFPESPTFGRFVHNQVLELSKRCRVLVLSPTPGVPVGLRSLRVKWAQYAAKPREAEIEGVPVRYPRYVNVPGVPGYLPSAWLAFLALSRRVRRLKGSLDFDLIHAHWACLDGPAAVWLGRLVRTPVVCTMHGSDVNLLPQRSRLARSAARHTIRNADALVAVSSAIQEKALSIGGIEREITVIPNGVNVQQFRPGDQRRARATLGVPGGVKMLVYLSRLDERKGLSHLVSAFKTVMGSGVDGRLYLVGEGPFRRRLEEQVAQLGLETRVILAGLRPHGEIPLWIQACDLVVHPSLSEGSPLPIYEALACGRPLVASRVGGIPELITGDDYGLLVPPGDAQALAAALIEGLEKSWDRQAIRSYGAQYSWSSVADRLIHLYRETLQSRQLCSTAFGLEKAV